MNGIQDLIAFREAVSLSADIDRECCSLIGANTVRAADQMRRAAESIFANIAEGYGRGVTRDGMNYLRMAHSSSVELEGHLRYAVSIRRIEQVPFDRLLKHLMMVRFLIRRFRESVQRRIEVREKRERAERSKRKAAG